MDSIVVEPKSAPPSPTAAPVRLSDYMEELLRFTLSASFLEDYDAPLGLPQEYSNNLLREDPSPSPFPFPNLHDGSVGVPAYPLYKHLARALEGCISSGTFFRELRSAEVVIEDENLMVKRTELDRLIMEKGTELVNMMGDVEFELHVQEPFFSQLRNNFYISHFQYNTAMDVHEPVPPPPSLWLPPLPRHRQLFRRRVPRTLGELMQNGLLRCTTPLYGLN